MIIHIIRLVNYDGRPVIKNTHVVVGCSTQATADFVIGEQIVEPSLRNGLGPLRLSGPGKPKGEQIITQVAEDYSCLVFCASQKFYVRIREQ